MSAEDSLARAEELLARLEKTRAELERLSQANDAEKARRAGEADANA